MPREMEKIENLLKKIRNDHVRNILKSTNQYLTPLALRTIVEYIIKLEGGNGT